MQLVAANFPCPEPPQTDGAQGVLEAAENLCGRLCSRLCSWQSKQPHSWHGSLCSKWLGCWLGSWLGSQLRRKDRGGKEQQDVAEP